MSIEERENNSLNSWIRKSVRELRELAPKTIREIQEILLKHGAEMAVFSRGITSWQSVPKKNKSYVLM